MKNIPTTLVKKLLADPNITHSGKALDIGFGHGKDALALAEAGYEVTAIDIDKNSVEELKEKDK